MSNVIEKEQILLAEINRLSLRNRTSDAISLTQESLKRIPKSAVLNLRMAEFYLDQKKFNLAEIYSSIAYRIEPQTHTLILLITALAYQGKFSKAVKYGSTHLHEIEENQQVIKALKHIQAYLKPLIKDGTATLQERVDLINIYKAFGQYDKASAHIQRLPNFAIQQREKEKLSQLWTAHLVSSLQRNKICS